jgi:hypothetical protein
MTPKIVVKPITYAMQTLAKPLALEKKQFGGGFSFLGNTRRFAFFPIFRGAGH